MALYLLGIFMGAIDTGIITPARPIIANDLGVDEASGIWMLTIYTLAYAASIPVMGKFADRRGRKPVYLLSIALFGVGSLLCGLSQDMASFPMLIAARALQAVGGGGILPIATAEISSEVPEERRGMALGLVGAVYGIANIFGASAGSLILDIVGTANWQWIFYVNLPIAVGILAVGWLVLPVHPVDETKPLDVWGTLLLVGIILSLLYGIKDLDFFDLVGSLQSPEVWPFILGVVAAVPLFVLVERRAADPVLNLGYFTDRGIGLTLLLSLLSGVVLMAVVFVPQLAENALRVPSGRGGYFVIVLGLASGVGAPLSGRLTDRFGPKMVLGLGFGVSAFAAATVAVWMIPRPSMLSVMTSLALLGLGMGFVVGSPLNYMMLQRTSENESASALGTVSLVRSIGVTLAPAIMVGFIAHGVAGLQTALLDELPSKITVPPLPHAQELTQRLTDWKKDERFAEQLSGVEIPDLTRTSIEFDPSGGGEMPEELVDLLKTADVTNITERTKAVAEQMFEANSPETIQKITSGLDSGISGVRDGVASATDARQEMTDGLAEMDGKLTEMADALAGMDASLREMAAGLKEMDSALADMATGARKMDAALAEMPSAIKKMTASVERMSEGIRGMDDGLAGQNAGIAGVEKPIAALDKAIASMDASLKKQREQLADLEAAGDPALEPQIRALEKAIAQLQAKRDDAASERKVLRDKLAGLIRKRDQLRAERDKLAAARRSLVAERDKLVSAQKEMTKQRAELARGREALAKQRAGLAKGRAELSKQHDKLARGQAEVVKARKKLDKARNELDAALGEMELTVTQLVAVREAVPGTFDQALADYLAEIDERGPRLEAVFESSLGAGFRGVYLFDMVVSLLAIVVLWLVPRPATRGDHLPD